MHTGEGKAGRPRDTHGEIQRHTSSETHADRKRSTVSHTERPTYMQKLRSWLRKEVVSEGEGSREKDRKVVMERGRTESNQLDSPAPEAETNDCLWLQRRRAAYLAAR